MLFDFVQKRTRQTQVLNSNIQRILSRETARNKKLPNVISKPSTLKFRRLFSAYLIVYRLCGENANRGKIQLFRKLIKSPLFYLCLKKSNYTKRAKQLSNVNSYLLSYANSVV